MYLPCRDFASSEGGNDRSQVVVLLSSEPHTASEKCKTMQVHGKKEKRLGRREERGYFLHSGFRPAALPMHAFDLL